MNTPQVLTFYPSPLTSPPRLLIAVLISLFVACLTSQARAVAVTARVAAIKGSATVSTPGGRETPLAQGDTVRAGSVISCSSGSGVLLRPAPRVSVVVFMSETPKSGMEAAGRADPAGTAGTVRRRGACGPPG